MKIEKLELKNVGRFQSLTVDFAPLPAASSNVTIFIGNNGAGKTSILRSLATSLSWLVGRIRSEGGSGTSIPEGAIQNGVASAAVQLTLSDESRQISWTLAKSRPGQKRLDASRLEDLSKLADEYRRALSTDASAHIPLIAFYPVERVVLDIPLKIKQKHTFLQLDGYDNSLSQGVDFRRFFEWFREREDWENQALAEVSPQKVGEISDLLDDHARKADGLREHDHEGLIALMKEFSNTLQVVRAMQEGGRDPQLNAVREAIRSFMPGFESLKVVRRPRLHMSVEKEGHKLDVGQLSQGEKSLMALVGDIARRLAMMNPGLKNPLEGNGVVLIDEIDMHLHPQWARTIVDRFRTTFPNCQFVLTTHSPLVISDCKDVLIYALDNGQLTQVPSQYGQDANTVLSSVMDTHVRNAEVARRFGDLLDLIQDGKLEQARRLLNELTEELPPDNIELTKASLLLRKREQHAKD